MGNPATLTDSDAAPDQVLESAGPGTPVGLTLTLAPTVNSGAQFSLVDNGGGAFSIDPANGVVLLAGSVDFEAASLRTIVARASVGVAPNLVTYTREFQITVRDSPAPTLALTFPFSHARFGDGSVSAAGVVTHPEPASLRVTASAGGTTQQGQIAAGSFQVRDVPVTGTGTFTLTVVASHPGGETATQSLTISREPELTDVSRMVLDSARDRVLLLDRFSAAIIASPLNGQPRSIVSGRHVGSGPAFREPRALCMDPGGQALFVAESLQGDVYRVDIATGNRTLLGASGAAYFAPMEMDFDPVRGRILMSDETAGILSIDPTTGERRQLSSGQSPGPTIYAHRSLAFDSAGDRILVSDGHSLFAVNPVNGSRSMLSGWNADPISRFFHGMVVAPQSNAAYMADEFANGVVRIDLANGGRATATSSGLALYGYPAVGAGLELQYPNDVVVGTDGRLFLVEGEYADPLVEVRPNGDRVVVRNAALGTGVNFRGPQGIWFDGARNALVVADNVADFIAEIDPATGNRTLVTGRADGRGSIDFDLMDAAPGAADEYFYVDFTTNALYAVRAGAAARVVSDANTGAGPALDNPTSLALDLPRGVAYVADGTRVLSIDLATGDRRVVAAIFGFIAGLAADFPNQMLYVAEETGGVHRLDLTAGTVRLISPLFGLYNADIAFDSATRTVIALREYPLRLDRIDEAAVRTTPIDTQAPGCGPNLTAPRGVDVDPVRQVAYVTDDFYDGVIAVDLRTGCRQLVAK